MKTLSSMKRRPIAMFVLFLMVTGCASTLGPTFAKVSQIPEGKGLIYVYRPALPYEYAVTYDVKANDALVAGISDGSYYPYFSNLGRVVLSSKRTAGPTTSLVLTVKANETYYVKCIPVSSTFRMKPELTLVDKDMAEAEIGPTRQVQ